jgi:uridylate kinase
MKYKRILLKLSGESLAAEGNSGVDPIKLDEYITQIIDVSKMGVELGIVIGGGNIFRGLSGTEAGFDRVKGDYMGMLATVINGLAIQSALMVRGAKAKLFTSIRMEPVADFWSRDKVLDALEEGCICIFSGGTGNPYFTTDTTAALRGVEIKADVLLKGTRVDGVYNDDPEKNTDAVKYDEVSFQEVLDKNLRVMDQTAFTLCRENDMSILVFNMDRPGNLKKIISGKKIGTLIHN